VDEDCATILEMTLIPKKAVIFANMCNEKYMNVGNISTENIDRDTEEKIMKYNESEIIKNIRLLCISLGFRSTLDTYTIVEEDKFQNEDVRNVAEELIKLMDLYSRSKKDTATGIRAKVKMILLNFTGGTLMRSRTNGDWDPILKKRTNRKYVYSITIEDADIVMMKEIV
jgi:hypothetical protein